MRDALAFETPHSSAGVSKRPLDLKLNSCCAGKKALGAASNFIDGAICGKFCNRTDSTSYRENIMNK